MLLLLALAQVFIFLFLFHKGLRKHPNIFYIVAVAIVVFLAADGLLQFSTDWPEWVSEYVLSTFYRGSFATALFIVIMFIGALNAQRKPVRTLMGIRAELSIFASVLTLGHNVVYGYSYFPMLFTNPGAMRPEYLAATIVTLILLVLLIPLFITSFPSVRKKMAPKRWKKLQRWAYLFYLLIYVHVLILFIPRIHMGGNYLIGTIVYTIIYAAYIILRLKKYFDLKHKRASSQQKAHQT